MNRVILMGRLTRDPEVRYSQGERSMAIARYTLAVDRRGRRGQDGNDQTADFINCVAWRQTGEFIAKHFQKGGMIAVVGSIQSRSWDGNDGKKQYATEVVVDEVYFTGAKKQNNNNQQQTPPQDNSDYYPDPDFPELDYPDESV